MNSETTQNVTYDNYDDFQHVNFIFSQNFILVFSGLFSNKTDFFFMHIHNVDFSRQIMWISTLNVQAFGFHSSQLQIPKTQMHPQEQMLPKSLITKQHNSKTPKFKLPNLLKKT